MRYCTDCQRLCPGRDELDICLLADRAELDRRRAWLRGEVRDVGLLDSYGVDLDSGNPVYPMVREADQVVADEDPNPNAPARLGAPGALLPADDERDLSATLSRGLEPDCGETRRSVGERERGEDRTAEVAAAGIPVAEGVTDEARWIDPADFQSIPGAGVDRVPLHGSEAQVNAGRLDLPDGAVEALRVGSASGWPDTDASVREAADIPETLDANGDGFWRWAILLNGERQALVLTADRRRGVVELVTPDARGIVNLLKGLNTRTVIGTVRFEKKELFQ